MGIHVNTFTECEASTQGLRIRVADPYIRVRKTSPGRPKLSAIYVVWFSWASGPDILVVVEPLRPTLAPDQSDAGLRELHDELEQLPTLLPLNTKWFLAPKTAVDSEPSLRERPIQGLVFLPEGVVHQPAVPLSEWIVDAAMTAEDAARAFALADGVKTHWETPIKRP